MCPICTKCIKAWHLVLIAYLGRCHLIVAWQSSPPKWERERYCLDSSNGLQERKLIRFPCFDWTRNSLVSLFHHPNRAFSHVLLTRQSHSRPTLLCQTIPWTVAASKLSTNADRLHWIPSADIWDLMITGRQRRTRGLDLAAP